MLSISGGPAMPTGERFMLLIVVGMGTAVALTFLFALFDGFVAEKLAAREHDSPEDYGRSGGSTTEAGSFRWAISTAAWLPLRIVGDVIYNAGEGLKTTRIFTQQVRRID